jgi:SAM-dependent methyltransferase
MARVTGATMADRNAAFVGEIPGNYDRYLGPIFFHGYADDLAARLPVTPGMRVLETACGTGIVTRRLADRIRGHGSLVATDLNEAMIAHGRTTLAAGPGLLEWQPADATKLPFPDGSFDAVVCQFGLMFFPDKSAGVREAFRVLKPGGRYLFNVWDAIVHNPLARIAHETVAAFFPADPPTFYEVPFSLHDPEPVLALLGQAGFGEIAWTHREMTATSSSSADAARGLIEGNPILGAIMERRPEALGDIKQAVADAIAAELGDHPVVFPLRAIVFSARRP